MRKEHGYEIWAHRTADHLQALLAGAGAPCGILIDGTRGSAEVAVFRDRFDRDFHLVAVHAAPDVRFQRNRARGRADDPADREAFDERDRRELSWGLGEAIAMADVLLVNETDTDTFEATAESVLRRWME